jgi:glycosyltransferase involved in cell wall biosynthesis
MKIGILGSRGIPNAYGGFEQFAQQLSVSLVKRGHEVIVYNSSLHPYHEKQWQGVKIVHCRDWEDKLGAAGQFLYDLNCIIDARKRSFDVLLQLGYTSNSFWHWLWPKNSINLINMDGLEWKRTQYSRITRQFLKKAEAWAAKYADHLIADSTKIGEHLFRTYNKSSVYIPYGVEIPSTYNEKQLDQFNLSSGEYCLVIARMEPENNIEMIINGFIDPQTSTHLVVVGNIDNKYGRYLRSRYQDKRIIFTGAIYQQDVLNNLRYYSKIYFHGHSVGGTNPSLLEAMACRCNIASHDNIFNKEVLGDDSFYFSSSNDVTSIILNSDKANVQERKELNFDKIKTKYDGNKVVDTYEELMLELCEARLRKVKNKWVQIL